jgi:hypothetical protein
MKRDKYRRIGRIVTTFFVVSAVLYAALGGILVYQAYAQQTRSWVIPTPNKPIMKVPTGADDVSVNAFFAYNNLRHVSSLQETYFIDPYYFGTMYLVIGVVLIVSYFLTYSWYSRLRRHGDLYPVEVYNGYLTERGGPIDTFNWVVWAIVLTYMAYYTVINLMFGQYY